LGRFVRGHQVQTRATKYRIQRVRYEQLRGVMAKTSPWNGDQLTLFCNHLTLPMTMPISYPRHPFSIDDGDLSRIGACSEWRATHPLQVSGPGQSKLEIEFVRRQCPVKRPPQRNRKVKADGPTRTASSQGDTHVSRSSQNRKIKCSIPLAMTQRLLSNMPIDTH